MADLFYLPLSQQAYDQFLQLQNIMQSVLTSRGDRQMEIHIHRQYSSADIYKIIDGYTNIHPTYVRLWKSLCHMKT
jgi:hypothetical protein